MLAVCQVLPSLTPREVWEHLEWHLFLALIDEWRRRDTAARRRRSGLRG